jgi:photosystem II stability/assembly factor-like uncharacterized protein
MVGHDNSGLTGADVHALAVAPGTSPQPPATVYAGTGGGVFRTTDGGATWLATKTTYYGGAYKTTSTLADNVFVGSRAGKPHKTASAAHPSCSG